MDPPKTRQKSEAKLEKKRAKAQIKALKKGGAAADAASEPSPAVRYAEAVRGVLYVVTALSLFVALVLGQQGAIVSLDDVIESLFVARTGKIILALIGAALLIYGLKHLRIVH